MRTNACIFFVHFDGKAAATTQAEMPENERKQKRKSMDILFHAMRG